MYIFDNAAPEAASRLEALADVFDAGTVRHLEARGVEDGWRCLEVGGGGGSIARWLAERVGPRGLVLATDIDPRHLSAQSVTNLEVVCHDILHDALPQARFDLVHSRLVLSHLADPELALARMVAALRPGGWLVVEDFEVVEAVASRGGVPAEGLLKTAIAMRAVTAVASNQHLGRSLARLLRARGLLHVDTEGRSMLYQGGSPGATLMRLNFQQLREPILATGQLTPAEFDRDLATLDDEAFEMRTPILWTAWGQRPEV